MYSVSCLVNGHRQWSRNMRTGSRYFKTKAAYRERLARMLHIAKALKKSEPSSRIEVETFFNDKPIYYITIV